MMLYFHQFCAFSQVLSLTHAILSPCSHCYYDGQIDCDLELTGWQQATKFCDANCTSHSAISRPMVRNISASLMIRNDKACIILLQCLR